MSVNLESLRHDGRVSIDKGLENGTLEIEDVDALVKIGYDTIMNNKEKILKLIRILLR